MPQSVIEEHGEEWTKPGNMMSNGAYVLTEHVPQERLVRERNEMYWDNENTTIEKTVSLIIPDESVALTRFLVGEVDRTDVPAGQFLQLAGRYLNDITSVPDACSYYYTVTQTDTTNPALLDPKMRQALSPAVNRDVIVDHVLAAGQTAAYTFTHWATAGFETPETLIVSMEQAERDVMAKQLLAKAGYGPETPVALNLIYNTSEAHKSVAIAINQMWKQTLGIETELAN